MKPPLAVRMESSKLSRRSSQISRSPANRSATGSAPRARLSWRIGWLPARRSPASSNNDEMALGALQAIKAAGKLGKIHVGGTDASHDALESMDKGVFRYDTGGNLWFSGSTRWMLDELGRLVQRRSDTASWNFGYLPNGPGERAL